MKVKKITTTKIEYEVILEDDEGEEIQVLAGKNCETLNWDIVYGETKRAEYGDDVEPEIEDLVKNAIERSKK